MKKIIQFSLLILATNFTFLTSIPTVNADTYVYQRADGLTLLTDKRTKKRGYKLKRIHRDKYTKRKRTNLKKSRYSRKGNRIGCSRYSAAEIDQRTRPYLKHIKKHSRTYGVDENLVRAIIRQESCFKPKAKSRVGAIGLMQLMPKTAKHLGISRPWNPEQNIKGGVKYISRQLERFGGDKALALAAYNAGPGAVLKYNGIPPYRETQNYVGSIMEEYQRLTKHRKASKLTISSKRAKLPDDFHIFWGKQ